MNARNNYLMNTLVLVSPDTDTARKSGIGYLDLRFPVRARLPTILNRHRFALSLLFFFSPVPPFSLLSTFFPSSLLSSLSLSLSLSPSPSLSFTACSRKPRRFPSRCTWHGWFRRRLAYQLCPKKFSFPTARSSWVQRLKGCHWCIAARAHPIPIADPSKQRAYNIDRSHVGRCICFKWMTGSGCVAGNPLCEYFDSG